MISYTASQPWPFPSSLMVGFSASAMKNSCEPYSAASENDNAVAVSSEKLIVVDEVRALPQTSADKLELEVFVRKPISSLCFQLRVIESGSV